MSNQNAKVFEERFFLGSGFARLMLTTLILVVAMSARADGIALTRTDDEYVVTVESNFVASDATVYLVWGAKDAAGELQEWDSRRELGDVSSAGGSFHTAVTGIAPGSKVRALIANKIELLDGYVSMDVQGQYVNTGCPENETWKTELGLAVNGASGSWSSLIGGTIDQFTVGRENTNSGRLYLRYNGVDAGRAGIDNNRCNDIVVGDGAWIVNGNTISSGLAITEALYINGFNPIHLGTTAALDRWTWCKWYYARFYGLDHSLKASFVPARDGSGNAVFYEAISGKVYKNEGPGSFSCSGNVTNTIYGAGITSRLAIADGITVARAGTEYIVDVLRDVVAAESVVYLVWGEADAGNVLHNWENRRELGLVSSPGGTFRTTAEGITLGCYVRALVAYDKIDLLDGYVSMDAVGQYVDTGCIENETWKAELGLAINGSAGSWNPLIGSSHDKFTIGRNGGNWNSIYLRYNDVDCGRASIDNSKCNDIVVGDGEWIVNGATVKSGLDITEALYVNGDQPIQLGTTILRQYWTWCKWYYARFYGLDHSLKASFVPARDGNGKAVFYETVSGKVFGNDGSGVFSCSGNVTNRILGASMASTLATAEDPSTVRTALWKGAGAAGVMTDAANWECRNANGEIVSGAIPSALHTVVSFGELVSGFDLMDEDDVIWASFAQPVNIKLGSNTDWTGCSALFASGATIDLNGFSLKVTDAVLGGSSFTDTSVDAEKPGTLQVAVASGTVDDSATPISGNMKLVKDGAGTLLMSKPQQLYTGGTFVNEGRIHVGVPGNELPVGADLSEIHVAPQGTFNLNGKYHICHYKIYLDGGKLENSVQMTDQRTDSIGFIALTADSVFNAHQATVLKCNWPENPAVFDMGGHTLTINMGNDGTYLDMQWCTFRNGKVKVNNGIFRVDGLAEVTGDAADFDIASQRIELYKPISTHDFTCRVTSNGDYGDDQPVNVFGLFRPVSQYFPHVVMQDGSSIDLSKDVVGDAEWSTHSALPRDWKRVTFNPGATVTLKLDGRTINPVGEWIVKWTEPTDSTVKFELDENWKKRWSLKVREVGIWMAKIPGTVIFVR